MVQNSDSLEEVVSEAQQYHHDVESPPNVVTLPDSPRDQNESPSVSLSTQLSTTAHSAQTAKKEKMTTSQHIREIIGIAIPIILSEVFQNTFLLIDLAFVGNLGKTELAAAALATVWFNLWNTAMFGFLTAIDTFLAQACGAEQWDSFGMWTGNSLVVTFGVSFIIAGTVATCAPAMLAFGQQPELAKLAGSFSYRLLPGLIPFYAFKVLTKYLQTQNILLPNVLIGFFANIFNGVVNYLLIYTFKMGLNGAPWATSLTRTIELIMIVAYMYWKKSTTLQKSWPTFSKTKMTWKVLKPFWQLGISGALSLSSEAWSFEVTTILAGLLGTIALDAHVVTLTIATFIFLSFPFAIGISTSIRVGQLIGEGKAVDAKQSFVVSIFFTAGVQILFMAILIPSGPYLGRLFTNDEDVTSVVTKLIPISAIFMLGDAIHANAIACCRGLGRQKLSLILNTLGFWVLAVPIGAILTFPIKMGVFGLWWGFNIGIYSTGLIGFFWMMYRIDWNNETEKAMKRISIIDDK